MHTPFCLINKSPSRSFFDNKSLLESNLIQSDNILEPWLMDNFVLGNGYAIHERVAKNLLVKGSEALAALYRGECDLFQSIILENILLINFHFNNGNTLLHFSVYYGCSQTIHFLIDNGANIIALNKNRQSPLHLAVESRKIEIIKILTAHKKTITICDNKKMTPLHLSAFLCYLEGFEYLSPNYMHYHQEEMIKYFIEMTIRRGDLETLISLLEKKDALPCLNEKTISDIYATKKNLLAFLEIAFKHSQYRCAGYLAKYYSNKYRSIKHTYNLKEIDIPQEVKESMDIQEAFETMRDILHADNVDQLKIFLEKHPNSVYYKDDYGRTILHYAVFYGDGCYNCLKYLIQSGADPYIFIDVDKTIFDISLLMKNKKCSVYLASFFNERVSYFDTHNSYIGSFDEHKQYLNQLYDILKQGSLEQLQELIKAHPYLIYNYRNPENLNNYHSVIHPLVTAAINKKWDCVEFLIGQGMFLNHAWSCASGIHKHVLDYVIECDNLSLFKLIMSRFVYLVKYSSYQDHISLSITYNRFSMLPDLLRITYRWQDLQLKFLKEALRSGFLNCVKILIEYGASVKETEHESLFDIVWNNNDLACLDYLEGFFKKPPSFFK